MSLTGMNPASDLDIQEYYLKSYYATLTPGI